jgi:hypothetical protein
VPAGDYTGKTPASSGAVMIRYKEYWGNQPGENDELLIKSLNVCMAALCPREEEVNAFFALNLKARKNRP